jgi:hypothetical protein
VNDVFVAMEGFTFWHRGENKTYKVEPNQVFTLDAEYIIDALLAGVVRPALSCSVCHRYKWWVTPKDGLVCGHHEKKPKQSDGARWITGYSINLDIAQELTLSNGCHVFVVSLNDNMVSSNVVRMTGRQSAEEHTGSEQRKIRGR